nr:glutamine-rich protein 2 isoform X1 [Nothobranchius furzeri]
MSESISLFDLLNVSIGTPHESSVNFSALHALLLAVLKQLDIRGLKIQWRGGTLPGETSPVTPDRPLEGEDEKLGAKAQRDVSDSEQQILSGTDGSPIPDPAAAILTRIQTCEGGVSEALELVQDLQKQKEGLLEKIEELHQQSKGADAQARTEVEKCCHRVDTLENTVSSLRETLQKYPEPEKLSQSLSFVQSAQFNAHLSKGPTNTDVRDSTTPVEPHSPTIRPPHTPPSSSPDEQGTTPAAPSEIANTSEASSDPPAQVKGDPDTTKDDMDSFEKISSSPWYQEMMVAVKTINKLQKKVTQLEVCLLDLEEHKMDQVQLAQLNELISNKGSVRHNNMMAQLNQQKVLIEDLISDRDKLDNLEEMVMTLTMKDRSSSSVPASESLNVESPAFDELRQHVLYLRKSLQKLEEGMKSLREQQVQLEERCSDQNLQDQLDDLRATLEDTILSETAPMSSGLRDRSEKQGVGEVTERSHQTSIPVDAGGELSLLQQQQQQLQDVVNGLIQQLNRVKALQLEERQAARNIGLAKDVQRAILQLQEDSEKLQKTTRILHEDSGQKQGLIEELYAMMEELEVKTTNTQTQEHKTQKTEGPVVVVKEQPETEVQEFPKNVVLPEEGWQEFSHRLSSELETKVNRIEVDYLMLQLEKRWKTIEDKLNSELDNACLIKRELFHCLSCDRPVLMQVPGPIVNTLPSYPALPSHKSTRPLNADLQQNKRLKPGASRYNCWMGTPGRKRVAFQRSYNDMCRQIDSMTSAWRRQENWDNTNQNPAGVQHEWTSELMDNQAVPRSSGGNSLQGTKLLTHTQAEGMTQEIGVIGLDGHLYKDCLSIQALKNTETKLPTIATKDAAGTCKIKNKAKNSASQRRAVPLEVGQTTPVHQLPPSARSMQCSPPASSCSGRDWPVSALGCCTSQSSITQTSAAAESADDPQIDEPLDL